MKAPWGQFGHLCGGAASILELLGTVPHSCWPQRELKQNSLPASSVQRSLHLIAGGKQGTIVKPCLVNLMEFFKETAPRVSSRSRAVISSDFKKAFDGVVHKRPIFQVSKCVIVKTAAGTERAWGLSPSPRQSR